MPQSRDSFQLDIIADTAKNPAYSKLFSEIFKAVFSVRILAFFRLKEAPSKAGIERLARLYAPEATTLFLNADFTAALKRLKQNRLAPVATAIRDAFQFPPNNSSTAERLIRDGLEAYRQLATSEKSKSKLLSELDSTYSVFVNSTIEATEAVLVRILDDTAGVDVENLLSEEGLIKIMARCQPSTWKNKTFEEFGREMSDAIDPVDQPDGSPHKYWYAVKKEIHILVCTEDKKYKGLREQLSKAGTKSQTAIVSMIAVALAGYVGTIAGLLVPMCALLMLAILKIGRHAFCAQDELSARIEN
jgi:hypothetical protein